MSVVKALSKYSLNYKQLKLTIVNLFEILYVEKLYSIDNFRAISKIPENSRQFKTALANCLKLTLYVLGTFNFSLGP